jgi:pantoate--beta-alanine ligase
MVRDLHFPVEIVICPTMRESDGLAMSSRNTYLQPHERIAAPVLYRALTAAKDICENNSPNSISRTAMIEKAEEVLRSEPLISHIEYVSVASPIDMKELDTVEPHIGAVISAAVKCGTVRLIDNVLVGSANDIIFS